MNILFITPSLAPGKDGVGDYTLLLASALRRKGCRVFCVSLADRFLKSGQGTNVRDFPAASDTVGIRRLSADISWENRLANLQSLIDGFKPDLISLQYVPYGYHPRGLPLGLPGRLSSLRGNFRWHIMLHELWIGEEPGYSRMQRGLGILQRLLVKKLASSTGALCHTSNEVYGNRLGRAGINSSILPLFSNIPISDCNLSREAILGELKSDHKLLSRDCWIFLLFGGIHPEWSPEPLLSRIFSVMQKVGRKTALFVTLGKSGSGLNLLAKALDGYRARGFFHLRKGEMSAAGISEYLQCGDYGIATSPLHLLGKSGSAAAFREHGLPVIVTRIDEDRPVGSPKDGFVLLDKDFEHTFPAAGKSSPYSALEDTATRFFQDLNIHLT